MENISVTHAGVTEARRKKSFFTSMKDNLDLWMFVLPGIVITFVFSYMPLYGLVIAFQRFSYKQGYFGSPWVGLDNFTRFFNSPYFIPTLTNTFVLSIYSLAASFPFPIILAILLNSFRHKRYGKIIQTVTYAPNFISTVVMCGMLVLFLSPSSGFVNTFIKAMGMPTVNFMGVQGLWRHIYVWFGIWQNTGFNSVIYFAALAGVNVELYEAATVDGASKLQEVVYIDIPSIMPTAIKNYVQQKQAQWITGQSNVDKDWDSYCKQLDKLGLKNLVKIRQESISSSSSSKS